MTKQQAESPPSAGTTKYEYTISLVGKWWKMLYQEMCGQVFREYELVISLFRQGGKILMRKLYLIFDFHTYDSCLDICSVDIKRIYMI